MNVLLTLSFYTFWAEVELAGEGVRLVDHPYTSILD